MINKLTRIFMNSLILSWLLIYLLIDISVSIVIAGQAIPVESFGRIQLWGDLMQIRRVDAQDAGRYICRASNQLGEQRAETHLSVTSKLNARIQPRLQVNFFLTAKIFNDLVITTYIFTIHLTSLTKVIPKIVKSFSLFNTRLRHQAKRHTIL